MPPNFREGPAGLRISAVLGVGGCAQLTVVGGVTKRYHDDSVSLPRLCNARAQGSVSICLTDGALAYFLFFSSFKLSFLRSVSRGVWKVLTAEWPFLKSCVGVPSPPANGNVENTLSSPKTGLVAMLQETEEKRYFLDGKIASLIFSFWYQLNSINNSSFCSKLLSIYFKRINE